MPLTLSDISAFYTYLTHHIVPGPQSISYFVPLLLLPTALLIPPTTLSHQKLYTLFLPLIYACVLHACIAIGGPDVLCVTFGLWGTTVLGCYDVRARFRRVRLAAGAEGKGKSREKKGISEVGEHKVGLEGVMEESYPQTFGWERIQWVLTLLISLRFNGWKIGDEKHDRGQPARGMSRRGFLRHAFKFILFDALILDVTSVYVRWDRYFSDPGVGIDDAFINTHEIAPVFASVLLATPPRLVRSSVLAAHAFASVSGMFYVGTPLLIWLNWIRLLPDEWSPQAWPTFFGSFTAVLKKGLRGLWGSWWHQLNRESCGAPGKAIADRMGLPVESVGRYICLVATAFFFSGVMHMGLIPPQPLIEALSANHMRLHVAGFFWLQVPGFVIEVAISMLVDRVAPSIRDWKISKPVTMAWTFLWLSLTLPLLTVPFRELGYWSVFNWHPSILYRTSRYLQYQEPVF